MSLSFMGRALSRLSSSYFSFTFVKTMSSEGSKQTNRLGLEKSPYLLQHAYNPVDWYPWGEEAFKAAKEQNKLIFLSVGYSTCHWCHVMERESFENAEIAKLMNENFINIKVDREERPDVDKVYMTFVTAASGHGGWPMSVFLTPELIPVSGGTYFPPSDKYGRPGFSTILNALAQKSTTGSGGWPMSVWLTPELNPIYGGTYFPPYDRYFGRPGFPSVLTSIASQWKSEEENFKDSGKKIMEVLQRTSRLEKTSSSELPSEEVFSKAFSQFSGMYEPVYGGFSTAPKFPQPSNFNFLFSYKALYPDLDDAQKGVDMCIHTLKMMDKGGIHDHISSGFARYSTDKKWHVPHFEKMLYDQSQLVMAYLDAFLCTKDQIFANVVRDIMTYVLRDLSHPLGGFFSAEDADSYPTHTSQKKKEGAFCVWTYQEICNLLSAPVAEDSDIKLFQIFSFHYSVAPSGNLDPYQDPHDELKNQNVLIVHGSISETASEFEISEEECKKYLERCREILYEARQERPRPHLDDKMLTAWNGMMLSASARAAAVLNDASYLERALKNAEFLKKYLYQDSCLLRAAYKGEDDQISLGPQIKGFSDDYAWVIRGLIHLYNATLDDQWLRWAEELQDKQNELFWDSEGGGYYMAQKEDESILLRLKDDHDGAEPSVNSVSAGNLIRLSRLLNRTDFEENAVIIFKIFNERLTKVPVSLPEMAAALMLHLHPAEQIIIAGDKDSPSVKEMLNVVHTSTFNPNFIILFADANVESSLLYSRHDKLRKYVPEDSEARAYVCKNFVCSLPLKTSSLLKEKIVND
ncbi:UNVERIFIED_CONTAM: hypothetical protein RMT77_010810 [Armadillidium vulgare]